MENGQKGQKTGTGSYLRSRIKRVSSALEYHVQHLLNLPIKSPFQAYVIAKFLFKGRLSLLNMVLFSVVCQLVTSSLTSAMLFNLILGSRPVLSCWVTNYA